MASLAASPPLPRRYAGGHAQWSSLSSRIRCLHRQLMPQTPLATLRALPID
jgi:hypothetical protein